jgi:hypothetical protein
MALTVGGSTQNGATNAASVGSQPVSHDHFGFDTAGIYDNYQATDHPMVDRHVKAAPVGPNFVNG